MAKEDMRAEQVGKGTEQDALRTAVMVERERLASKKDMEFYAKERLVFRARGFG